MSVRFKTSVPQKLLNEFKRAINDGRISTWSYDFDNDFTHTALPWKNLAWFRPKVVDGERLIMSIVKPKGKNISSRTYAIYHGRLIESMLTHFDHLFDSTIASAMPSDRDLVK